MHPMKWVNSMADQLSGRASVLKLYKSKNVTVREKLAEGRMFNPYVGHFLSVDPNHICIFNCDKEYDSKNTQRKYLQYSNGHNQLILKWLFIKK